MLIKIETMLLIIGVLAGGNINWVQPLWKTERMFLKKLIKIRAIIGARNPFSGYPQNFKIIYLKRFRYPYVHCSFILGRQDMK